jgi:hypothetical protein
MGQYGPCIYPQLFVRRLVDAQFAYIDIESVSQCVMFTSSVAASLSLSLFLTQRN